MSQLRLLSVAHRGAARPPLRIKFKCGEEGYTIDPDADQLRSFQRFARILSNRLGLWPRHNAEQPGEAAVDAWNTEVERAFLAGRNGGAK